MLLKLATISSILYASFLSWNTVLLPNWKQDEYWDG